MSSTLSATASATSSAVASSSQPTQYRPVGIVLAVGSGLLIGTSFVLKKKGLLRSQAGHEAGKGVAYLKSVMWWCGMTMMIMGELCNFGAYAFVEAILVTPLGALSVVICAILSHFFLKEKLTLFGWIGCGQCILGAVIIALNGPQEQSVSTIVEFKKLFLAPWFLAYGGVCIAVALVIIFFIAPKYGKKTMLWYITVCSLIGGISVSCTQGLGACILTSIRGENQFKNWFIYFLLVFVTITLLTEIYYLNVALALFNTAMVTPTYYVMFTFCTLVTSVILYQGLKASAEQILTIVLGFFVICTGIFILQMSKVDPRKLSNLDRKTTLLLQAARQEVKREHDGESRDEEKGIEDTEEPGMDAVSGRFGAIGGTVVRARRRATINESTARSRRGTNHSGNSIHQPKTDIDKLRIQLKDEATTQNGQLEFPSTFASPSPVGTTHSGEDREKGQLFPEERLYASPMASPAVSERNRVSSVRFREGAAQAHEVGGSADTNGSRNPLATIDTEHGNHQHLQHMPAAPPAALVATSNSSLPALNLPTPSLHVQNSMQWDTGNGTTGAMSQDNFAEVGHGAHKNETGAGR